MLYSNGSTRRPSKAPRRRPAPSDVRSRVRARQEGFALLVALLALVGLTALATGGFLMANSERKTATNYRDVVDALYVADAGLSQYLGTHRGTPSSAETYSYGTRGSVTVTPSQLVDLGSDGSLWELSSTGTTRGTSRTVTTVAFLDINVLPIPPGALTSGGGVKKNGASGGIDGTDQCGQKPQKAGVVLPPGGWAGQDNMITGNPKILETSTPFQGVMTATEWQSILSGDRIPHTYEVPPDAFPDFSTLPSDEWPVIYVDGNGTFGSGEAGRGVLIISGNATLKGNFNWDGLVMVGGSVTDNGQGRLDGGVMSGLNSLLGQNVTSDDLGDVLNGTKRYRYHSCNLANAGKSLAVLIQEPGTWSQSF